MKYTFKELMTQERAKNSDLVVDKDHIYGIINRAVAKVNACLENGEEPLLALAQLATKCKQVAEALNMVTPTEEVGNVDERRLQTALELLIEVRDNCCTTQGYQRGSSAYQFIYGNSFLNKMKECLE